MRIDIFIKLYIKLLKNCWWKSVHTKWQILVIACVITMVSVISAVEPGIVRIYDMTINRYDPYDIAIENIKKTEAIEYSKIVIERGAKKALVETKEIRTSYEHNDTVIIQGVENGFLEFYDYTLVLGDLPENENDILLDTKFIENKSYNVGDQICLELPDDNEKKSFKISGFIRNKKDEGFGIYRAYISIDSANSLLKSDDSYSLLITGLYDDENDLESFYKNLSISERFAEHISINSKRINAIIDRNKSPFAYICFGIGIFLTIVSGVLVFNIFQLSEKEKIQQIGLIRSIGLSKKQVRKYLNCEILMYIIIGTIIGVIFYTILELLFGRVILNIIANAFVERTEIPWEMDFRVLIMCCGLVSAIISFSYYIIFHQTYLYTPIDNIELREKNVNIKRKHGRN